MVSRAANKEACGVCWDKIQNVWDGFLLGFFFFVSVSFLWGAEGGRFEIYFLSALVNMKDLLIPYQL
jgi:hypothetical protein